MSRLLRVLALDARVDDVRRLRRCLNSIESVCVSLQHVTGSQSSIDRLPRMHADVLFIDEDLNRMTGVETIRTLRTAGETRPIIATTCEDCGYLAADLINAGADAYLTKRDLTPTMVDHVLKRALHRARGRSANDRLRRSVVRWMIAEHGPSIAGLA